MRTGIDKQKTKRTIIYFGSHERENGKNKNDCWLQSNHHPSPRATPCERGHGCAYKEMTKGQI